MGKRKVNFKRLLETASDRSKLALVGIGRLLKRPKYLITFLISLLLLLFILNFFKDGNTNWALMTSGLEFSRKLEVLGRVCGEILLNFCSLHGVMIILMALMQALIIPLLIHSWRCRAKEQALDGASTGSIGSVLGFVALGCPSCGVGLLTPILTAIAGTSAMALAENVSRIFSALALLLLLYTTIKLGYITYVNISNEQSKKEQHAKSH